MAPTQNTPCWAPRKNLCASFPGKGRKVEKRVPNGLFSATKSLVYCCFLPLVQGVSRLLDHPLKNEFLSLAFLLFFFGRYHPDIGHHLTGGNRAGVRDSCVATACTHARHTDDTHAFPQTTLFVVSKSMFVASLVRHLLVTEQKSTPPLVPPI